MLAVIFEAFPREKETDTYGSLATALRKELEGVDGFISLEAFRSTEQEGKELSLSFWRDEASIEAWRRFGLHRTAQETGRRVFYDDYRVRVATVIRDYGMHQRDEAPDGPLTPPRKPPPGSPPDGIETDLK